MKLSLGRPSQVLARTTSCKTLSSVEKVLFTVNVLNFIDPRSPIHIETKDTEVKNFAYEIEALDLTDEETSEGGFTAATKPTKKTLDEIIDKMRLRESSSASFVIIGF